MSISYHIEEWQTFKRESLHLWDRHWQEVAINRDVIKLNIDYGQYDQLDAAGALHVVAARDAGKIVGYHLSIVRPHLHYADSLSAFTDVYYVAPEFRKGRAGIELFKFVEKTLKARGVQKMFTGTKIHLDMSKVFERLGWKETERLYTKVI